nr:FHA domain-containing protein [Anaerolineae bacterium]
MHKINDMVRPLGLDIIGDAVIGRGVGADVDVEPYNAIMLGVSRSHALFRPAADGLYLVDLDSTNGTTLNGCALIPNYEYQLSTNDTILIGRLSFSIWIVGKAVINSPTDAAIKFQDPPK